MKKTILHLKNRINAFIILLFSFCQIGICQNKNYEENKVFEIPEEFKKAIIKDASIPDELIASFFDFLQPVYKADAKIYFKKQIDSVLTNSQRLRCSKEFRNKYVQLFYAVKEELKKTNAKTSTLSQHNHNSSHSHKKHNNTTPISLAANGPCTNVDFEQGDLSGWNGTYDTSGSINPYEKIGFDQGVANNNGYFAGNANTTPGSHTIMTNGVDPLLAFGNVFINRVYPGSGGTSLRLGNDFVNAHAESIYQQFQVTNTNNLFTYHFAVMVNDGYHTQFEQPFFRVRLYDQNLSEITCATFEVNANNGASNGLTLLTLYDPAGSAIDIWYADWRTVAVPLTNYVGQNITAEFVTSDCIWGAHFAYAYIDAECGSMQLNMQQSCQSSNTTISAPAGFASYAWNGPGIVGSATGQSIQVNQPGNYSVNIITISNNPCSGSLDTTITLYVPMNASTSKTDLACNGDQSGSVSIINQSGGIPPYQYHWSNNQTNQSISNLSAGTYSVTISDYTQCSITKIAVINQPTALTFSLSSTNSNCGSASGNILINNINGGSGGYSYSWNSAQTTGTVLNGLSAGTYTVVVSDQNNCTDADVLLINNTSGPVIAIQTTSVSCKGANNGMAIINNPQNGNYSYLWNTAETTQQINQLTSGFYSATVTDVNGCTAITSANLQEPDSIQLSISSTNSTCNGMNNGSAELAANGGTGTFTYEWSNNSTNHQINNLSAGIYSVTIADGNGCVATETVSISEPPQIVLSVSSNVVVCAGQSVVLSVSGAQALPSYQFTWQPGNLLGSAITVTPLSNIQYSITATDTLSGCSSASSIVQINLSNGPAVNISSDKQSACAPACISFSNTYQENGVTALWQFSDGTTYSNDSILEIQHCFEGEGSYGISLTLTDTNGCTTNQQLQNFIQIHPKPTAAFSSSANELFITESTVNFMNESTGASTYNWSISGNTISNALHVSYSFADTGHYVINLITTNGYGCLDTISDSVLVKGAYISYLPNAFTPNGDGKNDVFNIEHQGIQAEDFSMFIFDRWGDKIYETTSLTQGWDGTTIKTADIAQIDTYVYRVEFKDIFKKPHQLNGHVTLLK